MRTKKNEDAGLFLLLTMALVLPFAAWNGFVIKTVWGWFVAPLGIAQIGIWEAAGLYVLIRALAMDWTLSRNEDKTPAEKFSEALSTALVAPAFTLGFAAIYHALS